MPDPLDNAPFECPWVGHKRSGFGYHSGADGWRQFSTPKSIVMLPGSEAVGELQAVPTEVQAAPKEPSWCVASLAAAPPKEQTTRIAVALAVGVALGLALARWTRVA